VLETAKPSIWTDAVPSQSNAKGYLDPPIAEKRPIHRFLMFRDHGFCSRRVAQALVSLA
jgi:hypothetical protein